MDVSKLPKLSKTDAPPPPDREADEGGNPSPRDGRPNDPFTAPHAYADPATVGGRGEAWIAALLGVIFVFLGKNFGRFLIAKLTGQPFHTQVMWTAGPNAGEEVAYPDLSGFTMLTDAGMFTFGLTMLFEAAVFIAITLRAPFQRTLVNVAFGVALIATAFNVYCVIKLFGVNILPLMSLLAALFAGYSATFLRSVARSLNARIVTGRYLAR